jgi:oxygen-independent coproporphyrinogen-3 oxidase
MTRAGVYIHVPFCVRKCSYCDFLSYAGKEDLYLAYKNALIREIRTSAELRQTDAIDTIYIGGGTPTVLPPSFLAEILKITQEYCVTADAEITVEANPGTLNEEMLHTLRQAGVNRLSLGLQTWQDTILKTLGRVHTCQKFLENFMHARAIGFTNISVDVMFGVPGQTINDWRETLCHVCALTPQHISAYGLQVEEGTVFHKWRSENRLQLPDDETERRMYAITEEILSREGYAQYEISNYARQGFASKHNCKYWRRENTLGFGLGSHSFHNEMRWHNIYDLTSYVRQSHDTPREELFTVSRKEAMEETMFLGLRLNEGVCLQTFADRFGVSMRAVYNVVLIKMQDQGLLRVTDTSVALTPRGRDISNWVLAGFLL